MTYTLSVTGGYNGNALLQLLKDGVAIFTSHGGVPYNMSYNPISGEADGISILITPPATSTSMLYVTLTGLINDYVEIDHLGNNTSWGYDFSKDYIINSFNVAYNANGGTGTMATQSIPLDTPTALSTNTFTRENYVFIGWATSATGSVVYEDGETVENLAEIGETVTLYAVWQKAPLSISLQTNSSENNKMDKDVTTISTVTGTLRAECSIIDPVIIFELDLVNFVECNYITIPAFRRSYFVNNIRSIRNGLVEMTCHVDVLSSFKDEIRANSAIIHKSENDWNLYLNDGSLKTYQNASIYTHSFPSGFTGQSFVLAIAGE